MSENIKDMNVIGSEKVDIKKSKTASKTYKVKKDFTLDKLYRKGNFIELPDGKIKDKLTSNNFI